MIRLRWRLARLIAPTAVMSDPFPGDGSFVVLRQGRTVASYKLDKVDIKSETEPIADYSPGAFRRYRPGKRRLTVTGSAES